MPKFRPPNSSDTGYPSSSLAVGLAYWISLHVLGAHRPRLIATTTGAREWASVRGRRHGGRLNRMTGRYRPDDASTLPGEHAILDRGPSCRGRSARGKSGRIGGQEFPRQAGRSGDCGSARGGRKGTRDQSRSRPAHLHYRSKGIGWSGFENVPGSPTCALGDDTAWVQRGLDS
jgi:hypothetical protein